MAVQGVALKGLAGMGVGSGAATVAATVAQRYRRMRMHAAAAPPCAPAPIVVPGGKVQQHLRGGARRDSGERGATVEVFKNTVVPIPKESSARRCSGDGQCARHPIDPSGHHM